MHIIINMYRQHISTHIYRQILIHVSDTSYHILSNKHSIKHNINHVHYGIIVTSYSLDLIDYIRSTSIISYLIIMMLDYMVLDHMVLCIRSYPSII